MVKGVLISRLLLTFIMVFDKPKTGRARRHTRNAHVRPRSSRNRRVAQIVRYIPAIKRLSLAMRRPALERVSGDSIAGCTELDVAPSIVWTCGKAAASVDGQMVG
jgi:hypothetical protein